jgi:hypothetical protein
MDERQKELKQKVVTFLNRDEIDFLDKLGKDAWFSTGMKLSRIQIIEALVNLMMQFHVQGKGVTNKEDLQKHIIQALEKYEQAQE